MMSLGKEFISWIINNAGLASWIQAFGSIGAIFGAAYLTRYQIEKNFYKREEKAIEQLKEFFRSFGYYIDILDGFEKKVESGCVSYLDIKTQQIYIDELSDFLRSINLKDFNSHMNLGCVQARVHISLLKSFYASIDSLLTTRFSDVTHFSPCAIVDITDNNADQGDVKIHREIIFMFSHVTNLAKSISELEKLIFRIS